MKKLIKVSLGVVLLMGLAACGPKAFVKGDYDDVERKNLLNDQWSETDMQGAVKDLVNSMMAHPTVSSAKAPPIVMVTNLQTRRMDPR